MDPIEQYIVIGGELQFVHMNHFRDCDQVTLYGCFNSREEAKECWRSLSHQHVDNAHMRFKIVKLP